MAWLSEAAGGSAEYRRIMTDAQPRRPDLREFNKGVIANYRANGGKDADGALQPMVLLTTIGMKSGREHTTPVNVREDGDDLIVAGTKGGYPTHPQWYRNLQSNPDLTVEYHGDSWRARAITVDNGPDRDRLIRDDGRSHPRRLRLSGQVP